MKDGTDHEDGPRLGLFAATGIELEYMIVDRGTLAVRPLADHVLEAVGGSGEIEVEKGELAWSNELALHVIELKTNGPAASLAGLGARFHEDIREIDAILEPHGARLMPSGMHPWMDPTTDLKLWPHEAGLIYQTFDRIFDCRGHGWANLQSTHINLPFANDDEFGRLHAACRMILPLLPPLAASTPFADGRPTGLLDTRMDYYRLNARSVPSVSGQLVPEPYWTRDDYETRILGRIYDDMRELDPAGTLRHEWINSRGCIARFDRYAIEIRVLDLQESPLADLAVAALVRAVVEALVTGRFGDPARQRELPEGDLSSLFVRTLKDGDATLIDDPDYLAALGFPDGGPTTARDVWRHLYDATLGNDPAAAEWHPPLQVIFDEGCLARRILSHTGPAPDRKRLAAVYRELCDTLDGNGMLRSAG